MLIRETAKQIACPKLGTVYRALSADAGTNFGLSPALVVHDELGQIRGPRSSLYEALETATAAQEEPLTIIISTQAPTDADLLSVLIDDAKQAHDPHTVLRLHTADPDLDPFAEETIKLANPALDVFMNRKEVLAMAADAKRMPARQAEYENLVLNRRVETANPFVSTLAWKECGGEVADLHGVPLYGGLDLSSVADLTALVLIGKIDKTWHVKPTFWLPEVGLREKAEKDKVPYDVWHHKGFLETTPGNTVSYEHVAKLLFELFQEYNIRKIGFDRWNFKHDASNLVFPWQVSDASLPVSLPDRWRVPLVLTLLPLPPLSHPQPQALGALIFQRLIGTVGLQPLRGRVRRSRYDVFTSRLSRPASRDRSGSIDRLPHLALQLVWRLVCHLSVLALGTVGWRVARSGGILRPY